MTPRWQRQPGMVTSPEEGADVAEISLPTFEVALSVYYLIAPAEGSANLARFDGVRYGLRVREKRWKR